MTNATILPIRKQIPSIETGGAPELSDADALPCARALAAYLAAVPRAGKLLYGHQNDLHCKAGPHGAPFTGSDTADVCGESAAVMGIDALSLTGTELGSWDEPRAARIAAATELTLGAARQGALITLSAHMPNFALLQQRADGTEPEEPLRNDPASHRAYEGLPHILSDGSVNYSGYTPNDLRGHVVQDVLPGRALNALFTGYLDLVADYLHALAAHGIAVIWRPFHENTGGWFWWGCTSCTPDEFKALWRYTHEYLTKARGVHNALWAYSPGSEPKSAEEFAERYPGDAYVDLIGFDMYQQPPAPFWEQYEAQMALTGGFARAHGKLFANTETGIMRPGNTALLEHGNERGWYAHVADVCLRHGASYVLLWANFSADGAYYTPYAVQRTTGADGMPTSLAGHELLDDFIAFHNDGRVIFARGTPFAART